MAVQHKEFGWSGILFFGGLRLGRSLIFYIPDHHPHDPHKPT